MQLFGGFGNLVGGNKPSAGITLPTDSAPSWKDLKSAVEGTDKGGALAEARALQGKGLGPAHTDAKVRLFDAKSEDEIRVTLYRDMAAWCPYCQKGNTVLHSGLGRWFVCSLVLCLNHCVAQSGSF